MVEKLKFQLIITLISGLFLVNLVSSIDELAEEKQQYIVNNDACKLKRLDPWLLKRYYFNKTYIPCRQKRPFTTFERLNNSVVAVLDPFRINFYRSRSVEVTCCISNVTRVVSAIIPDNKTQESRCLYFNEKGRATVRSPIVKIRCFKTNSNRTAQAYENVYGFYLPDSVIRERTLNITNDISPFKVLMIGIGSISKQSALRTLPKTHEYLVQSGWHNFEGYGRVGESTLSNLIPILSGYSEKQAEKAFGSPWGDFYDNYEFIWNDYHKWGYVTSFAEDHMRYSIFNYPKNGFITSPTDFYFRPYNVASNKLQTSTVDRMPHCIGNQNAAERIFHLATDFVKTFQNRPYFGLFLFNTFSRDDFNAPCRMDKKLMEFFKGLEPYVNNTFIILFSDHGFIQNNITKFQLGLLESMQPFLYLYTPPSFKAKFSSEYENIKQNTKRLTSPYDLHVTLHDILKISTIDHEAAYASSCKKCNSLLRVISETRSCSDAGIDEEFCLCIRVQVPSNVTYLKAMRNDGHIRRKFNFVVLVVFAVVCDMVIDRLYS